MEKTGNPQDMAERLLVGAMSARSKIHPKYKG